MRETLERLPKLGKKAPQCHEKLGNLLSLLYQEACCSHGCPGGDHFGQRIAGRVVSHALASYRLLCSAYYDESLALSRNLGEIANLLWFFRFRPEEIERWRQSDKQARKQAFSPVRVRKALEAAGVPVPIKHSRYEALCDAAVHLGPGTAPQSHNPLGVPTLGAIFQEPGCIASLNELGLATSVCAFGLTPLLTLKDRELPLLARALLEAVGGVDLEALLTKTVFRSRPPSGAPMM